MNRNAVYARSSFHYVSARREAEALRRKEIARLLAVGAGRLRDARELAAELVRKTMSRVRSAGAWTFFGAH